jgi:pimeloyl-ACP methyl ester carboxylesterase
MQLTKHRLKIGNQEIACEYAIKKQNVVILHGAGASHRARYYPFAEEILKHDYGVVLFDFAGHGESSGELTDSSLNDRREQALQVIEKLLPKNSSFILVGFSMSGETVCNILPLFPGRVKTILLGCPAIYTKDAANIQFKDDGFRALIRTDGSWKNSIAITNLAKFSGKTFIAYGNKDEIIPREVINTLKATAKNSSYKQYDDASHSLAVWLGNHPTELSKLISEIIQVDSKAV